MEVRVSSLLVDLGTLSSTSETAKWFSFGRAIRCALNAVW